MIESISETPAGAAQGKYLSAGTALSEMLGAVSEINGRVDYARVSQRMGKDPSYLDKFASRHPELMGTVDLAIAKKNEENAKAISLPEGEERKLREIIDGIKKAEKPEMNLSSLSLGMGKPEGHIRDFLRDWPQCREAVSLARRERDSEIRRSEKERKRREKREGTARAREIREGRRKQKAEEMFSRIRDVVKRLEEKPTTEAIERILGKGYVARLIFMFPKYRFVIKRLKVDKAFGLKNGVEDNCLALPTKDEIDFGNASIRRAALGAQGTVQASDIPGKRMAHIRK